MRLAQEASFFKEPAGLRLGTLVVGTSLVPGKLSSGHTEITLTGWIFTASTRADGREGFDLSINAPGGENLRAEPGGSVLGRFVNGALFEKLEARGAWTRVRRTGWVAQSALPSSRPPVLPSAQSAPSAESAEAVLPSSRPPVLPSDSSRVTLRKGATLQRAPDGAATAVLGAPAEASVTSREGDWVKVRVDAWVKRGDIEGLLAPPPAITAAMLRENPGRYVGQTVEWRVQFLAHQKADELRPEMPLGHAYLLARGPLPESGFVYVMVSREQAVELRGLHALDELALTATVRAARTRYLATPVVELVRVTK